MNGIINNDINLEDTVDLTKELNINLEDTVDLTEELKDVN